MKDRLKFLRVQGCCDMLIESLKISGVGSGVVGGAFIYKREQLSPSPPFKLRDHRSLQYIAW